MNVKHLISRPTFRSGVFSEYNGTPSHVVLLGAAVNTYIRSGLCLWIRAQKAKPSRKDVVMLVIDTSRYPSHWILHHCWSAFTAAMVQMRLNHGRLLESWNLLFPKWWRQSGTLNAGGFLAFSHPHTHTTLISPSAAVEKSLKLLRRSVMTSSSWVEFKVRDFKTLPSLIADDDIMVLSNQSRALFSFLKKWVRWCLNISFWSTLLSSLQKYSYY